MIEIGIGHCWLTFDNGYTLSIFNGYGSYSENNFNRELMDEMYIKKNIFITAKSKNCEVAILYDGMFVTSDYLNCNDSVKDNVSFDELLKIIDLVRNLKR